VHRQDSACTNKTSNKTYTEYLFGYKTNNVGLGAYELPGGTKLMLDMITVNPCVT